MSRFGIDLALINYENFLLCGTFYFSIFDGFLLKSGEIYRVVRFFNIRSELDVLAFADWAKSPDGFNSKSFEAL